MKKHRKNPEWLDRNEYPFESHFLPVPAGSLHYIDEGQGDPVVMVHGNPGWSFEYRSLVKVLSAMHRCIVPDHIGFGLSDKPQNWSYRPKDHAANFEQLMLALNLSNVTLIVSDWGGPIGLAYALKYPDRIKKIIVLNSWLWSVKHDPYYRKFSGFMGGFIGRLLIRRFNFFGKVIVKKAMGEPSLLHKNIHRHYYRHLATAADRKGCYTFPKEIIASSDWLDELWQQRQRVSSLPTTIIWGMRDIAFRPQELNYWTTHWGNPRVVQLERIGHFPQEESPEVILKEFHL